MCFVFIWEQTATCATYSINWLVFITKMKSVYCAVRTESLILRFVFKGLKYLITRALNIVLSLKTRQKYTWHFPVLIFDTACASVVIFWGLCARNWKFDGGRKIIRCRCPDVYNLPDTAPVPILVIVPQQKLIDFYNRDEKCLLRGTNWVFK